MFLDSDDLLIEDSIERRARILETAPEVDVVYGDMFIVDGAGQRLGVHRDYMPGPRPSGYILGDLALRCFVLMPAMVRRKALADLTFDEGLHQAEDYDLWRRLAARGQFCFVEEPIAVYRLHDANTITNQHRQMLESELEVQARFFLMTEFQQLTGRERARAYRARSQARGGRAPGRGPSIIRPRRANGAVFARQPWTAAVQRFQPVHVAADDSRASSHHSTATSHQGPGRVLQRAAPKVTSGSMATF